MVLLKNSQWNSANHMISFHLGYFRFAVTYDVDCHSVFPIVVDLFDFMTQFYGAGRKISSKNCDHTVETSLNNYVTTGKFE